MCAHPSRSITWRRSVAALCVVVGGLLLWSAPALALSQQGHVFSFAFGSAGSGAGQFSTPTGIAANGRTGNVYVADRGNGRIERFTCTASSCTFASEWALPLPEEGGGIAVDNSTGGSKNDVYVALEENGEKVIRRYSAEGTLLGTIKRFKEGEGAEFPKEEFGEIRGIAVDRNGNLYVYREFDIIELKAGKFVKNIPAGSGTCESRPGFAVGPEGESLYIGTVRENSEETCEEEVSVIAKLNESGGVVSRALDREQTSGAAVDLSTGNVYLDNVTKVTAFDTTGLLIQSFGAGQINHSTAIAVDSKANTVYVADTEANRVEVFGPEPAGAPTVDSVSSQNLTPTSERLNALVDPHGADTHAYFQYGTVNCAEAPTSCTTVPAVPGKDLGSGFGDVAMSVEIEGLAPATTYYFRVVATNAVGTAEGAGILNTLPSPVGVLPDNRAWEMVSPPEKGGSGIEAIGGFNSIGGPAGGVMQASEDGSAVTYIADAPVVPEPEGSRSPEGTQVLSTRGSGGWSSQDIVTPHNKAEGFPSGAPQEYQFFSSDLSHAIVAPNGFHAVQEPPLVPAVKEKGETEERGLYVRSNATCQATPATCYQPIVTKENDTKNAAFGGELEFLSATSDMSHIVFRSKVFLTEPLLEPEGVYTGGQLYEWQAGKPLQLVSVLPNGRAIESEPIAEPEPGYGNQTARNVRHAISNDGSRVFWTNKEKAISPSPESRLYMRDMTAGKTVQVNAPFESKALSEEELELQETHFQIANSDGSRVFFTDTAPLTADSKLHQISQGSPSDLYEYEPTGGPGGKPVLTDLTAQSQGGPADVQGTVLGASEDGSSVYFVANGVLASPAQAGSCGDRVPGETCNLYVDHYNSGAKPAKWETTFIAALSREDEPDWLRNPEIRLTRLTSRVSPNGQFVAFMSNRPLTGYENVDANPEANGARDEEVFVYDAATRHLVCASCKTGGPPHGVHDVQKSGEGNGLLVDRPEIWPERWLAGSVPGWTPLNQDFAPYQSRYLSDQGRLFFNSPEALVENDTNGKEDVYQYEPGGVGGCASSSGCVALISSGSSKQESALIDATPSGNDVFFITSQPLVSSDRDSAFDLYDARVCTEASPCIAPPPPPPPPCSNEATCRPPSSPQPGSGGAPASAIFSGPGNAGSVETLGLQESKGKKKKLTNAQKLAKALKACQKKYKGKSKSKKKKRAACEKQARRLYGKKSTNHAKGKK
jgi:DNA-binding beta-propeller fold protein YncE